MKDVLNPFKRGMRDFALLDHVRHKTLIYKILIVLAASFFLVHHLTGQILLEQDQFFLKNDYGKPTASFGYGLKFDLSIPVSEKKNVEAGPVIGVSRSHFKWGQYDRWYSGIKSQPMSYLDVGGKIKKGIVFLETVYKKPIEAVKYPLKNENRPPVIQAQLGVSIPYKRFNINVALKGAMAIGANNSNLDLSQEDYNKG